MDSLPYMCRFQYEYAAELITAHMDPMVAAYSKVDNAIHMHRTGPLATRGQARRHAWFQEPPHNTKCLCTLSCRTVGLLLVLAARC